MHRPAFLFLTILLSFGCADVWTQSPTPTVIPRLDDNSTPLTFSGLYRVGEVKGTVKNAAIALPKPTYPFEAISLDASGKVRVDVAINEEGAVISAKANSGPESLRSISEETAMRTRFRPFRIDGLAIQTKGEMIYEFNIEKPVWFHIGYEVGGLPARGSLRYFPAAAIKAAFDEDWVEETHIMQLLAEMRLGEVMKFPFALPSERPYLQTITKKFDDGSRQTLSTVEMRPTHPATPTIAQIQLAEGLLKGLRERLTNKEIDLWNFNLGVELGTAFASRKDPRARSTKADNIKRFIDSAPKGVDPITLKKLETINTLLKEPKRIFDIDLKLYKAIVSTIFAQ